MSLLEMAGQVCPLADFAIKFVDLFVGKPVVNLPVFRHIGYRVTRHGICNIPIDVHEFEDDRLCFAQLMTKNAFHDGPVAFIQVPDVASDCFHVGIVPPKRRVGDMEIRFAAILRSAPPETQQHLL